LFVVYPRVSLYPGETLDSHDPFQTPFIIKNDGYLPLYNIDYLLNIEKMEDINQNQFINVTIGQPNRGIIPKLNPNKASTLFINRTVVAPPNHIKYMEANIRITYRPFLVPFNFTENIRFKTERKSNGEYVWLEYYSNKK
jgi:hypothetical protein